MSTANATKSGTATVAVVGNPNTGKSTVFSALSGIHQKVGNYPGVTVEKKLGTIRHGGRTITLIDLPGTYSLAPRSPDEMVAVDVLTGRRDDVDRPDAVLCVVDASNLERNLYVVSQVLEMALPTVVALNMIDVARSRGIEIDLAALSARLGVPVIPIQANKKIGLDALRSAISGCLGEVVADRPSPFPQPFRDEVERISEALASRGHADTPRYLVERLLLDSSGYVESRLIPDAADPVRAALRESRGRLAAAGLPVPAVEAMARYGWVAKILGGIVARPAVRPALLSDRLDRVLTHRVWGSILFVVLMLVMFQAMFRWSKPPMALISAGVSGLGDVVSARMSEGPLRSLLVDGVIAGVGAVLVFLPQILLLFAFIAILEDCGYMARAAYLMDRLMARFGLSGKSFIPLLSSFACAIPGVMATRVIENRRDRLTTILIAPLMSCSARLPVYGLLIAAFIPDRSYAWGLIDLRGLTMLAMYNVGIVFAVLVAWILKRTMLRGPTPPFVMELPGYKVPSATLVMRRMVSQGIGFVRRAGTMILAVSVIVWAAAYFPRDREVVEGPYQAELAQLKGGSGEASGPELKRVREIEVKIAGEHQKRSYLGRAGRFIEPVVRPLGWDWRIGCAAIASFPAREVVVATLGVLFEAGEEVAGSEDSSRLQSALRSAKRPGTDRPLFTVPVALSLMVFFALCAQCAATLAVIRRETNSWRWPAFTFAYMTILAYFAAMATYQIGIRFAS